MTNSQLFEFQGGPLDGQQMVIPWGIAAPSSLLYAAGAIVDFDHPDGIYEMRINEEGKVAYYWRPLP